MTEILPYWSVFLHGLGTTALVTVLGGIVAVTTAFTAGLAQLSLHRVLRWPAFVFVEVFRGTSMLVQMFWFFFALPFFGVQLTPMAAAVLAVGLNEGVCSRDRREQHRLSAAGPGRGLHGARDGSRPAAAPSAHPTVHRPCCPRSAT